VQVVGAEPRHVFDSAAVEAIRRAKFSPALRDGVAVESQQHQRIQFSLGGAQ
jgi:protein TonB